jgi:hypothetical protein
MAKVKCTECGEIIEYLSETNRPEVCTNKMCDNILFMDYEDNNAFTNEEISSLELTYLKTGDRILVKNFPIILGTENIGGQVLSKIRNEGGQCLISRRHCSLISKNGKIYIMDLGSTNKTFIDNCINVLECVKGLEYELSSNNFLILGKEIFSINISIEKRNQSNNLLTDNSIKKEVDIYKCFECGYQTKEKLKSCPECRTYNSFE